MISLVQLLECIYFLHIKTQFCYFVLYTYVIILYLERLLIEIKTRTVDFYKANLKR